LTSCVKVKRENSSSPPRTLKCKKEKIKKNVHPSGVAQVVDLLSVINAQLIGINNNINNDFNNLSSVISNGNSNLNANMVNSISALNASLKNSIVANTNTIISNMNTVTASNCTVKEIGSFENFTVPCGKSEVIFENLSTADIQKVFISAASNQNWYDPCQAVLVVVTSSGTIIERALPPKMPPNFFPEEIHIVVDNFRSISIRCDFPGPDPSGGFCSGFVQVNEFVCICCNPNVD